MRRDTQLGLRFTCPYCNKSNASKTADVRHHSRGHANYVAEEVERHFFNIRYPDIDLDYWVQRYKDRLECDISLYKKNIRIKFYLQTIGVWRSRQSDLYIWGVLKRNPHVQTAEDVTKAIADELVNKFRKKDKKTRFEGYLNRDMKRLENDGHAELIPFVKTLKTIKFVKEQMAEAREPKDEATAPADTE